MTNNYYYITTGQLQRVELYDIANAKSHYYTSGGNKMYVLRHSFEADNGTVRDWYVKTLSKNIDVAIEKAKEWVKENGEKNHDLIINNDYQEVDPNGTIPQWVKDIKKSNQIEKDKAKERLKKWEAERERKLLEQEKKNKKILLELSKSEYVGQPKDRLEKKLTIKSWFTKEITPYCYGADTHMNIITLEDEDKNLYTYFGSASIGTDIKNDTDTRDEKQQLVNWVEGKDRVGNTYTVKFTVKKHSLYTPKFARNYGDSYEDLLDEREYTINDYGVDFKGSKQTVIQRPKVIN